MKHILITVAELLTFIVFFFVTNIIVTKASAITFMLTPSEVQSTILFAMFEISLLIGTIIGAAYYFFEVKK